MCFLVTCVITSTFFRSQLSNNEWIHESVKKRVDNYSNESDSSEHSWNNEDYVAIQKRILLIQKKCKDVMNY